MINVSSADEFRSALQTLRKSTHGDTLAILLALKWHQDRLPRIGDGTEGVTTGDLEHLFDFFYTKRHQQLGPDSGKVCFIFNSRFKPQSSNRQNNWRDILPYKNGFSCLAPEEHFTPEFLGQSRSECGFLTTNLRGAPACSLHRTQPGYIRGLDKPKFLKWQMDGGRGDYRLTWLNETRLLEYIRPLTSRVPLEPLIQALYFGASWNRNARVTVEDFARDFHFSGPDIAQYLFATDVDGPGLQRRVQRVKESILEKLQRPFVLIEPIETELSVTEKRIRERGFTNAVRDVYDNACAVCQLKIETPEGRFEVQAAHICQHAIGGADDIRNGIALCRSHHWAFEQFLFTVSDAWELIWHPSITDPRVRRNGLLQLPVGRGEDWPDPQALRWHRERFEAKRGAGGIGRGKTNQ